MKIVIAASSGISLINFRGKLIQSWIALGHEVVCISIEPPEEMNEIASSVGASYFQVAGDRIGIGLLSGLKMFFAYYKTFKKIKPDFCFLYMSKPIAFGCPAAKFSGVKHINVLINGLENAFYRKSFKDAIVRFVMKAGYFFSSTWADNVFIQNHDDYALLLNAHVVSAKKMHIVNGSGVDMEHFLKKPLPDKPVFLMTARLLWSKGIREYLNAISIVKEKYPQTSFMLVGGLDYNDESLSQEELEKCIKNYDIDYCGFADDVRPHLEKCSIFVLPSYHEGTPRSVLEAMATGRAIITTAAPGCRDTVEDGINGFLVPVGDSELLAKKMCTLIENAELREFMAEQAHRICCEKYDAEIINKIINGFMFSANTQASDTPE